MLGRPAPSVTKRTLAWWEAATYLTVAQIYLQDNPLLDEPLRPEHIKPRLLGHWGTSPGLNLVYAHLNNLIRETGQEVLFVAGPGHGGPAVVASVYLEGTYSAVYPEVSRDREGLLRLVRRFSTPGGIPSHVSVPTPGSIHEGGELGYSHHLAAGIAAMAASLGGLDALVFTGGVGENIAEVRAEACRRLAFLGLGLDDEANRTAQPDRVIADSRADVPTVVVRAREDLVIAAGVRAAIGTTR